MPTKKETVESINESTGEVVEYQEQILTTAQLNSLDTSEAALRELVAQWGLDESDLIIGDVYPLADKDDLIDVPLVLIQWRFGTSQNWGGEYVQIQAARADTGEKLGIFDSGVGIMRTLSDLTDARLTDGKGKPPFNGALAPKGLTVSDYPAKYEDGVRVRPAGKTYYIG